MRRTSQSRIMRRGKHGGRETKKNVWKWEKETDISEWFLIFSKKINVSSPDEEILLFFTRNNSESDNCLTISSSTIHVFRWIATERQRQNVFMSLLSFVSDKLPVMSTHSKESQLETGDMRILSFGHSFPNIIDYRIKAWSTGKERRKRHWESKCEMKSWENFSHIFPENVRHVATGHTQVVCDI